MTVEMTSIAQVFEGTMLVCFGVAWPVDIYKTLRKKQTAGKSVTFMACVLVGYVCGLAAKFIRGADQSAWPETVTLLYVINAALVAADIAITVRIRRRERAAGQSPSTSAMV